MLDTVDRKIFADLNPDIPNIVLIDGVDEDDQVIRGLTTKPLARLQSLILGYFHAQMPCIACGSLRHSTRDQWNEAATLVEAKIPVIYIDIRRRKQLDKEQSLRSIWEIVKGESRSYFEALLRSGRLDVLNTCKFSYFHSVFTREDPSARHPPITVTNGMPIYEAIEMLKSEFQEEDGWLTRLSSQVSHLFKFFMFRLLSRGSGTLCC